MSIGMQVNASAFISTKFLFVVYIIETPKESPCNVSKKTEFFADVPSSVNTCPRTNSPEITMFLYMNGIPFKPKSEIRSRPQNISTCIAGLLLEIYPSTLHTPLRGTWCG